MLAFVFTLYRLDFILSLGFKIHCSDFFASWAFGCGQYLHVSPLSLCVEYAEV